MTILKNPFSPFSPEGMKFKRTHFKAKTLLNFTRAEKIVKRAFCPKSTASPRLVPGRTWQGRARTEIAGKKLLKETFGDFCHPDGV
jgi:hypothetical protein